MPKFDLSSVVDLDGLNRVANQFTGSGNNFTLLDDNDKFLEYPLRYKGDLEQYNSIHFSLLYFDTNERVLGKAISLPMPQTLTFPNGIKYEEGETRRAEIISNFSNLDRMEALSRSVGLVKKDIKKNLVTGISEAFIDNAGKVYDKRIAGEVKNNYSEMFFEGVELRQFTFDFVFIAESEKESEQIRKIVKAFRASALPRRGSDKTYLKYPDQVEVSFYRGGEQNLSFPKIKKCFITNVEVSYGENVNGATFSDGSPVETRLSLSITEDTILTSEDVIDDF